MGPSPNGLKPFGLKSIKSFMDELQELFKPFFKLIRVKESREKDKSGLKPFIKGLPPCLLGTHMWAFV